MVETPSATAAPTTAPAEPEKAKAPPVSPARRESKVARPAKLEPAAIGRGSILQLFAQANPMLWPLALCSVVTLGFALERLVALRRERVIPRDFVDRFLERLSGGKLDRDRAAGALPGERQPGRPGSSRMVVSYWGQPAATIRQAIGYDAAGEVADLKRNVRVLNGTATLAPLLGLLGTVIGMIQSFDALGGRVGAGARARRWRTGSAWPWWRRRSAWGSRSSRSPRITTCSTGSTSWSATSTTTPAR